MVKKVLLFGSAILLMASCQTMTQTQTARTETISSNIASVTLADLEVYPERVNETIEVTPDLRRGGVESVKHAVEASALEKNGRGDLLVEPQYVIKKKWSWSFPIGSKITEISVSGRPASFKNFRSLNDSVWTNPIFRGMAVVHNYDKGTSGKGSASSSNASAQQQEKPSKPKYNWRPKGIRSFVDLSIPIGLGGLGQASGEGGFNILYTFGYQFNRNLFAGVGIGYSQMFAEIEYQKLVHEDRYLDGHHYDYTYTVREDKNYNVKRLPLFIRGRAYFCRTRVAPFFDVRFGYEFGLNNPLKNIEFYDSPSKASDFGRLNFSPSIGFSIATKRGRNIDFSVTYSLTTHKHKGADHYLAPSMTVAF